MSGNRATSRWTEDPRGGVGLGVNRGVGRGRGVRVGSSKNPGPRRTIIMEWGSGLGLNKIGYITMSYGY